MRLIVARFIMLTGFVGACVQPPEPRPSAEEIRNTLGYNEYVLTTAPAPPGFVDFYAGPKVLAEVADTGTFTPTDGKNWSLIRLPTRLVDRSRTQDDPVTMSLCDAANEVTLVHNWHDPSLDGPGTNCTPGSYVVSGYLRLEYQSGDPGVFGYAVVGTLPDGYLGRKPNGHLYAGGLMEGLLPSQCPGDTSMAMSDMMIGSFPEEDSSPEDPMLADCKRPDVLR